MKPYEGFIFICGGPSDVTQANPISVRDALQRELAKDRQLDAKTRIAEHYKDWSKDGVYSDLLEFENHIAQLSSVIVLIIESAGSIAELGLFSALEGFREKLLVVVETEHYNTASFIRLGPIDYLEKSFRNIAECHRWLNEHSQLDHHALAEVPGELVAAIRQRIKSELPVRVFDPERWADVALMICELISLFSALTFKEIQHYLKSVRVSVSDAQLHQHLYILERLEFIFMEPKGSQRFYVSRDERSFVSFDTKITSFDLIRFRLEVIKSYEKDDKKRSRAIQEVRRRNAS